MKIFTFILMVFLITACTPVAAPLPQSTSTEEQPLPTETLTWTATPQPSLTPTLTFTPTATMTPAIITLSDEEKESILQSYKVMLFIQVNGNLLSQTATKVKEGELAGMDSFGALIATAALINATDEAIPETTVPEIISPYWEQALPIHSATKDLVAQWFNEEIDSSVVVEEIAPYLSQIESIISKLDKDLASVYGFDEQEMSKYREEVIQSIDGIFATKTPAP